VTARHNGVPLLVVAYQPREALPSQTWPPSSSRFHQELERLEAERPLGLIPLEPGSRRRLCATFSQGILKSRVAVLERSPVVSIAYT